jgi:hypothetical protein
MGSSVPLQPEGHAHAARMATADAGKAHPTRVDNGVFLFAL